MKAFGRLPGFPKECAKQEWQMLCRLPLYFLIGTVLLGLLPVLVRIWAMLGDPVVVGTRIMTVDIMAISLIVLHWTVILTLAIAIFIIYVMKGPAYVADAYPLEEDDSPQRREFPPEGKA